MEDKMTSVFAEKCFFSWGQKHQNKTAQQQQQQQKPKPNPSHPYLALHEGKKFGAVKWHFLTIFIVM